MGTLRWKAPELIQGKLYSKEIDIWAFGCFAYELATGMTPFNCVQENKLVKAIVQKEIPALPEDKWSDTFRDFIDKCLQKKPEDRWSAHRLLTEHEFLVNIDEEKCRETWVDNYASFR